MFKIGDFAKLCRVPVRTLRYYHDIGVLQAAHVDTSSGYRFYTSDQLVQLNRILALKDLGLSLEEIAEVLTNRINDDDLNAMLRVKQFEIERSIHEAEKRLTRIKTWLVHDRPAKAYEVAIKQIPTQTVAIASGVAPDETALPLVLNNLFATLSRLLHNHHVSCNEAGIVRYVDEDFTDTDIQVEALIPLNDVTTLPDGLQIREIPAFQAATVVFCGDTNELPDVYHTILKWLDVHSYQMIDSPREVHLPGSTTIIEVQVPIQEI